MYDHLLQIVSELIPLEPGDAENITSFFEPLSVKKDMVLVNKGDFANIAFFINSGYLRYFGFTETGEEQTIHLSSPGEFAASFHSFVSNTRSNEILHAITDAELLRVRKDKLEGLYSSESRWQIFGRKLMEKLLLEKEKRIIEQLSLSAQARYMRLMETNPLLVQHVPIQYIASYIGIKPESLSRIRKQIFLTNVK